MRAASHELALRQPTAGGALSPLAASLECCLSYHARSIPARRSLGIVSCSQSYSERPFFVRRTPRACHGACNRLRPGRLRASHAVCLRCSTVEPVICARKEGADIESLSTIESILVESLVMRGDIFDTQTALFGFHSTSRRCIPRRSPRNSNLDEVTANNGAAANRSGCHGSCYSGSDLSSSVVALSHVRCRSLRATLAATAPASAVAELESLAAERTPTRRPAKDILLTAPTLTRRLTTSNQTL